MTVVARVGVQGHPHEQQCQAARLRAQPEQRTLVRLVDSRGWNVLVVIGTASLNRIDPIPR
jgi:hypothetical protein